MRRFGLSWFAIITASCWMVSLPGNLPALGRDEQRTSVFLELTSEQPVP